MVLWGFMSILILLILCMMFLLGNVNEKNTGKAGFAVVLLIASFLVSSFGLFGVVAFQTNEVSTTFEFLMQYWARAVTYCTGTGRTLLRSSQSSDSDVEA